MGWLGGFGVTLRQIGRPKVTEHFPQEKRPKPVRFHGRHVLNRYEDGMEKCIGCELCAGVCPAKCIYVRGQDNDPDAPTSPGDVGFSGSLSAPRTWMQSAGQTPAHSSHPMHFSMPSS